MMETIESFSNFLERIGSPNFLIIAIVIILLWLLIAGIIKGLKKGKNKISESNNENEDD